MTDKRGWMSCHNYYFIISALFPKKVYAVLRSNDRQLELYESADTSGEPALSFDLRNFRVVWDSPSTSTMFQLESYSTYTVLGAIRVGVTVLSTRSAASTREWVEVLSAITSSSNPRLVLERVQVEDTYVSVDCLARVEEEIREDVERARRFTRAVLSSPCSGEASDKSTMIHVLAAFSGKMGQEAVFYEEKMCENLPDSLTSAHVGLSEDTRKLDVHLESIADLMDDEKQPTVSVEALDSFLQTGTGSRQCLEAVRNLKVKLARVHGVSPSKIKVHNFYDGCYAFKYSVDDLTASEIAHVERIETRLKSEFAKFQALNIHPLFFRAYFNVGMFDEAGNKDFTSENSTYELGSGSKAQQYEQPHGWFRYGLKVLYPKTNKYGTDNTWLDPFQNPNMWHKAFHGTAGAPQTAVPRARQRDVPVSAMASVYQNGFVPSKSGAYGAGVYCAESVRFYDGPGKSFLGEAEIDTVHGKETWQFLIMAAVRPGSYKTDKYHGDALRYILVGDKKDIRPYGLLIRKKN